MSEASSRVIQRNPVHPGLTASVTQTQAGGLLLLSTYNEITNVANAGDALTAFGVFAGDRLIVVNNGANDLQLFPAVGDDIGAGVNAAITIVAGGVGAFIGRDTLSWDRLYNNNNTVSSAYTRNAAIVEDRTLLASASATILNNNNVLAALIADLQTRGILG